MNLDYLDNMFRNPFFSTEEKTLVNIEVRIPGLVNLAKQEEPENRYWHPMTIDENTLKSNPDLALFMDREQENIGPYRPPTE